MEEDNNGDMNEQQDEHGTTTAGDANKANNDSSSSTGSTYDDFNNTPPDPIELRAGNVIAYFQHGHFGRPDFYCESEVIKVNPKDAYPVTLASLEGLSPVLAMIKRIDPPDPKKLWRSFEGFTMIESRTKTSAQCFCEKAAALKDSVKERFENVKQQGFLASAVRADSRDDNDDDDDEEE